MKLWFLIVIHKGCVSILIQEQVKTWHCQRTSSNRLHAIQFNTLNQKKNRNIFNAMDLSHVHVYMSEVQSLDEYNRGSVYTHEALCQVELCLLGQFTENDCFNPSRLPNHNHLFGLCSKHKFHMQIKADSSNLRRAHRFCKLQMKTQ